MIRKNNLLAYFKLNSNTIDFSGNGYTIATTGAQTFEVNEFGKSVQVFSGTTNHNRIVNFPNLSGFASVRFRVKFNSLTSIRPVITKGTTSSKQYYVDYNAGNIRWIVGDMSLKTTAYSIVAGVWYDVVLVKDSGRSFLYINGVLVDDVASGVFVDNTDLVYVGTRSGLDNMLNGSVGEVMLFNVALSPTEILQLYKKASNVPMKSNVCINALDFNGVDNTATNNFGTTGFDNNRPFLVEWFGKLDIPVSANNQYVFSSTSSGRGGIWVRSGSLGRTFITRQTSAEGSAIAGGTYNTANISDKWVKVRAEYDGVDTTRFYVDGVHVDSVVNTFSFVPSQINGNIDKCRIAWIRASGFVSGVRKCVFYDFRERNLNDYGGGRHTMVMAGPTRFVHAQVRDEDKLVFHTRDGILDLAGRFSITNVGGVVRGKEMVFNGSNNLSLTGPLVSNVANKTFAFTCSVNALGLNNTIFNDVTDSNNWILIGVSTGNDIRCAYRLSGSNVGVSSSINFIANTNYRVVCVLEGNVAKLYVNGVLQTGTNTLSGVSTTGVSIGKRNDNDRYLSGKLFDFEVYANEIKSADWVKNDYLKSVQYW